MSVVQPSPVPSEADIHLVYQLAHHDIWWAKTQLWAATNWALALLTAVVGIGAFIYKPEGLDLFNAWPFIVLAWLVAVGSAAYLARLHYDIVRARRVAVDLRSRRAELATLVDELPIAGKGGSEATRGASFAVVLLTVLGLGFGVASYLLTREKALTAVMTGVQLCIGYAFVAIAVNRGAA